MSATILVGHVIDRLRELPDESVHCVVTSPPYFGLRDYGVPGQIGLEPTLADYLATMVAVFRDVRRVLRSDGTCWLNIGDSYASAWPAPNTRRNIIDNPMSAGKRGPERQSKLSGVLKEKDLMMVPARLAIALQDDGWWIRSDVIWGKPNPMPESVTDRPTTAHEHIFMLSKSARYYCDMDAVRLPLAVASIDRLAQNVESQNGSERANGGAKTNGTMKAVRGKYMPLHINPNRNDGGGSEFAERGGANLRNVWMVATKGFDGAHFAVFPPEIPRRCILMGCPPGGTVLDPFLGSGTTLLVADQLGRNGIGIELNPSYAAMAEQRIRGDAPMFADVSVA